MDNDQYQPISCSAYDVYEIAIMRNQQLDLQWWDGDIRQSAIIQPLGLEVRDGAEYLVIRRQPGSTEQVEIRLDRIISSRITGP